MDNFLVCLFFLICVFVYFVPAMIASKRDHENKTIIIVLNIFFGWSGIGWIALLIWASCGGRPRVMVHHHYGYAGAETANGRYSEEFWENATDRRQPPRRTGLN